MQRGGPTIADAALRLECEESVDIPDEERSAHLRAVEYDLRAAHDIFMRHYAAGEAPDCRHFLPFQVDRT